MKIRFKIFISFNFFIIFIFFMIFNIIHSMTTGWQELKIRLPRKGAVILHLAIILSVAKDLTLKRNRLDIGRLRFRKQK